MRVYKELSIVGKRDDFEEFKNLAPSLASGDWKYSTNKYMRNHIAFDYSGNKVEQAEVSFFYGPETWRDHEIKVVNIVPLLKEHLTIDEYNAVLDLFYIDVIQPYQQNHANIKIVGPTSDIFDPLEHISEAALKKLECFCNSANKTTGSSHPSDEERWFEFICQTVDDKRTFDFDTLSRFLADEEYWGKRDDGYIGAMGHFAWDEEQASELASEYDSYVRILQFYLDRKWKKDYEAAQK